MTQTAVSIDWVGHHADVVGQFLQFTQLTVDFRVFSKGLGHVAGITYTTDNWVTPVDALARFQFYDGDFEVWQARVGGGNPVLYEYVIFCRDNRGVTEVPQIFNTNGGETFQLQA